MNESLQDAIKEAYAVAPSTVVILHTLEISQEGVQDSVYIVQSPKGFYGLDENEEEKFFEPVGFQFSLPPSNEEGFKSLTIAIDNVDRRIGDFIRTALANPVPVLMKYRPYLSTDPSTPQMNPPLVLTLRDVEINAGQVTGKASFVDIVNKKFPTELYTRARFPALG